MAKLVKYISLPQDIAFILPHAGQHHPPVEVFAEASNVVMDLSQIRDQVKIDNIDYGPFHGRTLKASACSGWYSVTIPTDKSPFNKPWVSCNACLHLAKAVEAVFKQDNLKGSYGVLCKAVWAQLIFQSSRYDNPRAVDYLSKVVQDTSLRLKDHAAWRNFQEKCRERCKFMNWTSRAGHLGADIVSEAKSLGQSPEDTLLMRFSKILKDPQYADYKDNVIVGLVECLCSKAVGASEPFKDKVIDLLMLVKKATRAQLKTASLLHYFSRHIVNPLEYSAEEVESHRTTSPHPPWPAARRAAITLVALNRTTGRISLRVLVTWAFK